MIIGLGGISRVGKTTLSKYLKKIMGERGIVIHMDDYIKDSCNWDVMIKKPFFYLSTLHRRFDLAYPETIVNFDLLLHDIVEARRLFPYVIVEGSYIVYDPRIRLLIDKLIFLNISKKEFINRRLKDFPNENKWYANHLWNQFLKYGIQYADLDFIILDAKHNVDHKAMFKHLQLSGKTDLSFAPDN